MTTTNITLSAKVRNSIFKILGSKSFKVNVIPTGWGYDLELLLKDVSVLKIFSTEDDKDSMEKEFLADVYRYRKNIKNNYNTIVKALEKRVTDEKYHFRQQELKARKKAYLSIPIDGVNYYLCGYNDGYDYEFCYSEARKKPNQPYFPNKLSRIAYNVGFDHGSEQGAMDT